MAFSHPEVYISELAQPICRRFQAEPTSYDLAIASCIILFHFADVVAHVRQAKAPKIADEITDKIPDFAMIRAIANAGKHVELKYHPKSGLVGLRAEHLVRDKSAAFDDGTYFSDGTTFSDMSETVVVETPDGVKHDVLHLCLSVLAALSENEDFFKV
jgi:lactam utilization protein B